MNDSEALDAPNQKPKARLPDRVAWQIKDQDDKAEILISVIQLVIVVTFLTLYTLSPKAFDPTNRMLEPVPIAGVLYIAFTLGRLMLAIRRIMPAWVVYLSIVVDMALLMIMIWSFHLQYDQPASFYLKAPTLLYVFIFISLRALRFQARFVVFSGIAAAIGWFMMVAYALFDTRSDPMSMITRDYIAYMTDNQVLVGAEFDKVVSILVVTAIVAFAIRRARGLLVRAVSEEVTNKDLSRFFAPEVAEQIRQSDQAIAAGQGELRHIAVLTVDIRGFTTLTATSAPSDVIALLGAFHERLVSAIQAHGGAVDKFTGDGLIATFGAFSNDPAQRETYAADAFRATDSILEAMGVWNREREADGLLPVRIGVAIDAGEVLVGAVGSAERLEYTVIGDAVNRGAKLEKENKVQKSAALATSGAFSLAAEQGYPQKPLRQLPGISVGGIEQPVDLVIIA